MSNRRKQEPLFAAGLVRRRQASGRRYREYRDAVRRVSRSAKAGVEDFEQELPPQQSGLHVDVQHRARRRRQRGFFTLLTAFWQMLGGQRPRIIVALAVTAFATAMNLLPLYAPKIVIDHVIGTEPLPGWLAQFLTTLGLADLGRRELLWVTVSVMLSVVIFDLAIGMWARWQATKAARRTVVNARRLAFDHAVRLPLHRVYDLKSGGVASILRDDAGGVGELVFSLLYNPSKAIVQLTGTMIVLTLIRWELLVGALLVLPIVWMTHRTWISRIRPLWRDIRYTRQGVDAHATEAFGGMRVVRTFNRQSSESTAFTANNHLMTRQELYAWWWMRGIDAAWQVIIPASIAALLLFGGFMGIQGRLTGGELAAFLAYLMGLLQPIATLATNATALQNHLAGLDRTIDLLNEPKEFATRPDSIRLDPHTVRGHIVFDDVHYSYPVQSGDLGEEHTRRGGEVIRGVSLDVAPGTVVALVGPSGAGKTTLCNLVARFFDPTAGRIMLDGIDLRDIHIENYRRLLGIVEQDTFLFDGTIAQNIAYGRRDARLEDVIRAAKLANAHGFISDLPEGYDSLIGERGVKLSGGQRQRLTIARAILADPRILILDEATSNLDTESERLIQGSLAKLMKDRTCFVIAHRLSTIQSANLIAVVEGGRVAETGTHAELMSRSGRYRHMVELQTEIHPRTHPVSDPEAGDGF